jgi:redox-sensitive bicupin YhaK (pirin superfamily)
VAQLQVETAFEHGIFVVQGELTAESSRVQIDQLLYLGAQRRSIVLRSDQGCRAILLGGEPFNEQIVMWWNFVGRSHEEIVAFRRAWERRDLRFPPVVNRTESDGGSCHAHCAPQAAPSAFGGDVTLPGSS